MKYNFQFSIFNFQIKWKKGFTLIELLVVISIIGILAALLTASFSQAQKQGRDTKRRGDMKSVQSAFEQFQVANSYYPKTESAAKTLFQNQLVPCDPRGGANVSGTCITTGTTYKYNYVYDATDGKTYCVCALLEITGKGKGNATDNACTMGIGDYACAKNLQ